MKCQSDPEKEKIPDATCRRGGRLEEKGEDKSRINEAGNNEESCFHSDLTSLVLSAKSILSLLMALMMARRLWMVLE